MSQRARKVTSASRSVRENLSNRALTAALKTRRSLAIPLHESICVYDAAEELGVEVRFDPIPSMEGMYVRHTLEGLGPHILVCSQRPAGRQAMTASHELGHHVFNHGTRIDEYVQGVGTVGRALVPEPTGQVSNLFDPDEFLADVFGAFLLMPKSAVERGFSLRGITVSQAKPLDVLAVAGWLGVGYTALVYHICLSLRLITWSRAQELLSKTPKVLREEQLGRALSADLYIVDSRWTGRPVDLKIGDIAIVPDETVVEPVSGRFASGRTAVGLIQKANGRTLVEATNVGISRLVGRGWATFVRVAEREYQGRNSYRHLEAVDDD